MAIDSVPTNRQHNHPTGSTISDQPNPIGSTLHHNVNEQRFEPRPTERHACLHCDSTFGRPEHLKRHMRSHGEQRPFECQHCHKSFPRRDTLNRHRNIHQRHIENTQMSSSAAASLARAARACIKCAAARARCSGTCPCVRCQEKSIECQYPQAQHSLDAQSLDAQRILDNSVPTTSDRLPSNADSFVPRHELHPVSLNPPQDIYTHGSGNGPHIETARNGQTDTVMMEDVPSSSSWTGFESAAPSSNLITNDFGNPHWTEAMGVNENFSGAYLEQGIISDLNWLPLNFPESYYADTGLSPTFSLPFGDANLSFEQHPGSTQVADMSGTGLAASVQSSEESLWSPSRVAFQATRKRQSSLPRDGSVLSGPGSSSAQEELPTGSYYVDGEGARLPVSGKRRKIASGRRSDRSSSLVQGESPEGSRAPSFADMDRMLLESMVDDVGNLFQSEEVIYMDITSSFYQTCAVSEYGFSQPQNTQFLSHSALNHLIQLAIDNFLPVVPIIHPSCLDFAETHWILHLALAAMGSHYLEVEEAGTYIAAIHNFLCKAIASLAHSVDGAEMNDLNFAQAKLLNRIGSIYSGNEQLRASTRSHHTDIIDFAGHILVLLAHSPDWEIGDVSNAAELKWKAWLRGESSRRTAYCIWLLDCMLAYHYETRTLLTLEDALAPLPCEEALWDATSMVAWARLLQSPTVPLSLYTATQVLYVEKKCQQIGEFSRILLVHALFQQTWTMSKFYRQPLSSWTPSAPKQANGSSLPRDPIWLPGSPSYSRWRNCACDCLDVLHWAANSTIGAASGVEHPTVLHLHIARVVLLTPIHDIRRLAFAKVDESETASDQELRKSRLQVQRWLKEDQYKARLAMIHAGVLFWHVRRHSANGFYEPDAVLLASIAMWAYGSTNGSATLRPEEGRSTGARSTTKPTESESITPDFIHLDRPTDDELVQLFVKNGNAMIANVTGVGNLRGPKGPERILREACKLLSTLPSWGVSAKYVRTLTRLADLSQKR